MIHSLFRAVSVGATTWKIPRSGVKYRRHPSTALVRPGFAWTLAGWIGCCVAAFADLVSSSALKDPPAMKTGFTSMAAIAFTNAVPEHRHITNQILLNGSGVAAGDVDGDGRVDVFCAGLGGGSRLYRQVSEWAFTNITDAAGLSESLAGLDASGAVLLDWSGDGSPDLAVSTMGQGTRMFLNNGRGVFRAAGILNPGRGGTSLAFADVDGDGWLDLYQVNYRTRGLLDLPNARANFRVVGGRTVVTALDGRPTTLPDLTNRFVVNAQGGIEELGEPDRLYRNLGGTNWIEISWTEGAFLDETGRPLMAPPFDWGLSAQWADLNEDGSPELFVANDFNTPDRLWINESKPGRIQLRAADSRILRHTSRFSMGIDVADVNADGRFDILVLDMLSRDPARRLTQIDDRTPQAWWDPEARPQYEHNTLFVQREDGAFDEVAAWAGLLASEWAWTPAFMDVDLDGHPDLLVSAGTARAARDLDVAESMRMFRRERRTDAEIFEARKAFPSWDSRLQGWRNLGNGRFEDAGDQWGFAESGFSQGMCLADLDGDGDLDVLVNRFNGRLWTYRNNSAAPRLFLRVDAGRGNRAGIGVKVSVRSGNVRQRQILRAGGRYLSSDAPGLCFAVPTGNAELTVDWPDGTSETHRGLEPGRLHECVRGRDHSAVPRQKTIPRPWFVKLPDESSSRRSSSYRPAATALAWNHQDNEGGWMVVNETDAMPRFVRYANGRIASVAAPERRHPRRPVLPYEAGWLLDLADKRPGFPTFENLPVTPGFVSQDTGAASRHPWCVADVDGDSDLDVFLSDSGGNGRWWIRDGSEFRPEAQVLPVRGTLTSMVAADVDLDGWVDVAMAADWGPIQLWLRRDQQWIDATSEWGLANSTGRWNVLVAEDVDGDGRMDLVAGNSGENTMDRVDPARVPVRWEWTESDGSTGWLEALGLGEETDIRKSAATDQPRQPLKDLAIRLPWLRARFSTARSFAESSIDQILEGRLGKTRRVAAVRLASGVFFQGDRRFEWVPFPTEAQWSSANALAPADLDADGETDVFLAQNRFGEAMGPTRSDAGRGLLLRGKGNRSWEVIHSSGIDLSGEQRAVSLADYDGDGRMDLAVGYSGGDVAVYKNQTSVAGLRLSISGSGTNPRGIGLQIRPQYENQPRRILQMQSGGLGNIHQPGWILGNRAKIKGIEVGYLEGGTLRWRFAETPKDVGEWKLNLQR